MKAIVKATGKEVDVLKYSGRPWYVDRQGYLYHRDELGMGAQVLTGYVARDFGDGPADKLFFYSKRPTRGYGSWQCSGTFDSMHLPERLFPLLRWEDEPMEVEIIISPL